MKYNRNLTNVCFLFISLEYKRKAREAQLTLKQQHLNTTQYCTILHNTKQYFTVHAIT